MTQRAAFLLGAVSGGAESGESQGSQLTSAREIEPGTAVVIGAAFPSTLMYSAQSTGLFAYLY